jgi:N-acetylglucosamine-6-phosphate deacetylase
MKAIINAHIIKKESSIKIGYLVFDDKIVAFGKGDLPEEYSNLEILDAKNNYVFPGMIDIHTHGACGFDFLDVNEEKLNEIISFFNKNGVTSFLATTVSADALKLKRVLSRFEGFIGKYDSLIGVHLEGPFLSKIKSGAHQEKYLTKPNLELINKFSEIIKVITYAPETDPDHLLKKVINKGIILSAGHTNCSYEESEKYLDYIKSATHIFNAMPNMHHRIPMITTAILLSDLYTEVIADKVHLHPAFLNLIYKLKKDKIILVTDSISATGKPDGVYRLGNQKININEGIARVNNTETLAGSTLKLIDGVRNFYNVTNASIEEVVSYVTSNPANLLGLKDRGYIKKDYRADFVIANKSLSKENVLIGGKEICV